MSSSTRKKTSKSLTSRKPKLDLNKKLTPAELAEEIERAQKKANPLDLSPKQDLCVALMNLISIEEHFFFSGAKTGKTKYYDLLKEVRKVRKELLKQLVPNYTDGSERWCISKHLLAASMRLMEVGTKHLDAGKRKESEDLFQKAYDLYSLFWGINLELIELNDVKAIDPDALDKDDPEKSGFKGNLNKLLQKIINCCLE